MSLNFLLKPFLFFALVSFLNGCFSSVNNRVKLGDNTVPDNSDLGKLIVTNKKVTLASPSSVSLLVQSSVTNYTQDDSQILASESKKWEKGWDLTFSSDISKIQSWEQEFNIFTPDDSKKPLAINLSYYNQEGDRISSIMPFPNGKALATLVKNGQTVFLNKIPDENLSTITKLFAIITFELEGADCYAEIPPMYINLQE